MDKVYDATNENDSSSSSDEAVGPREIKSEVTSSYPEEDDGHKLPPCRVCGGKASGFHYGANTCEACKGFFRRSLKSAGKYKCVGRGNCRMDVSGRVFCPHCRYLKCLAVGMSRDAINKGRYSHEKRANNILEAKRVQEADIRRKEEACAEANLKIEMEMITQRLTDVYVNDFLYTKETLQKVPQFEQWYLEQKGVVEEMFNGLGLMNLGGVEMEQAKQILKDFLPSVDYSIKKYVNFAKALPGFTELPMEDRISLLKAAKFECFMLSSHEAVNVEKGLYTNIFGLTISFEEFRKISGDGFVNCFFEMANKMKRMQLDSSEVALLQCITILMPDRVHLLEREKVEGIQEFAVRMLQFHLQKTRPYDRTRFAEVLLLLHDLREADHEHDQMWGRVREIWPDIEYPPLMDEMWR